ncbi:MAG: hypothetical protein M3292_11075, partial [Actinomycetota bacterium]|nr:hypothetical protein [Actinomycetota bacterium]
MADLGGMTIEELATKVLADEHADWLREAVAFLLSFAAVRGRRDDVDRRDVQHAAVADDVVGAGAAEHRDVRVAGTCKARRKYAARDGHIGR